MTLYTYSGAQIVVGCVIDSILATYSVAQADQMGWPRIH
jgi:hypothetical protein